MQGQSPLSRLAGLHAADQFSMTHKNLHERGLALTPRPHAHPHPHPHPHAHQAALDDDEHAEEEEEVDSVHAGPQRLSLRHSTSAAAPSSTAPSMAHSATSAIAAGEEENATMVKNRLKQCGLSEELIDMMRPTVTRDQIGAMWSYYDVDKVQNLTSSECKQLSQWLYSRIPIMFRNMIARANPHKSREEQNRLVVEHLPFLLPGTSEEISCYFVASLVSNADGRVSKDEFVKCWNRHARLIFPSARQKSSERGTLYCTIL